QGERGEDDDGSKEHRWYKNVSPCHLVTLSPCLLVSRSRPRGAADDDGGDADAIPRGAARSAGRATVAGGPNRSRRAAGRSGAAAGRSDDAAYPPSAAARRTQSGRTPAQQPQSHPAGRSLLRGGGSAALTSAGPCRRQRDQGDAAPLVRPARL